MDTGSGSPPPDRPGFGPGSPGYGPGAQPPPDGPQSPAPGGGPQSPAPGGQPPPEAPQSPAPADSPAPSPTPPYAPPVPPGPESPAPPSAPPYGGPVPPGGWQQSPAPRSAPAPRAPLASWGSRLGAYVIDGLVVAVPATILFFLLLGGALGVTGTEDEDTAVGAAVLAFIAWFILLAILWLVYAPLLMIRAGERNGQTWGKQVVGIRAVRDSGEPWSFGSAAVREVVLKNIAVWIAASIIPIIPWFLNFFWPLWDDQNRALHDMAASSHVVDA